MERSARKMDAQKFATGSCIVWGSMAQWLARQTCDAVVVGSIPPTAHVVIALGKQFTFLSSVDPSVKRVLGHRQLNRP